MIQIENKEIMALNGTIDETDLIGIFITCLKNCRIHIFLKYTWRSRLHFLMREAHCRRPCTQKGRFGAHCVATYHSGCINEEVPEFKGGKGLTKGYVQVKFQNTVGLGEEQGQRKLAVAGMGAAGARH